MKEITVTAPTARYPILIGEGLLQTLPALLAERKLTGKVAIVTNETLAPIYGESLLKALGNAVLVTVPDGEQYKSLDTVRTLYDAFISAGLDRRAVIVALGGGVVGDMVGFAAATYLRGVAFVQVPTSLLAMVDSSVGGKVGVDVPQGKNLIGAFKQPELVVVDPSVLKTLPDVEWRCGLAEIVKAGLLRDLRLLDASLYKRDTNDFSFIQWAIQYKVDVVQQDPYENSIRAYLNLGHTFAHALERVSNYGWRHGEAVSVGLVFAARLSAAHGLCAPELPAQVEQLLQTLNMPIRYTGYDPAEIRAAMGTDKKRQDNRVRFILLRAAGDPLLCDDVPDSEALAVIEAIRA